MNSSKEKTEEAPQPIFAGCIFFVDPTGYDISAPLLPETPFTTIINNIAFLSGEVLQSYNSSRCTHVITRYMDGTIYSQAKKDQKVVVTAHWIDDCFTASAIVPPDSKFIYQPVKNADGIEEMRDLIISVTGILGTDRSDLKYLIRSAGAKFTGELSKKNTHLVVLKATGKKCEKALDWGVHLVKQEWLFESLKQWRKLRESDFTVPIEGAPTPTSATKPTSTTTTPTAATATAATATAAAAAAATTPTTATDRDAIAPAIEIQSKRKRNEQQQQQQQQSETTKAKKPKITAPSEKKFLVSGTLEQVNESAALITALGGTVSTREVHFTPDCTHIIMSEIKRTEKFLCGVAAGKWILKPQYLVASMNAKQFLDEESYEWFGAETLLFNDKALWMGCCRRWRKWVEEHEKGAFHGWKVIIHGATAPPSDFLHRLIEAGGGTVVNGIPSDTELDALVSSSTVSTSTIPINPLIAVIDSKPAAIEANRASLMKLRAKGIPLLIGNFLLDFLVLQETPTTFAAHTVVL